MTGCASASNRLLCQYANNPTLTQNSLFFSGSIAVIVVVAHRGKEVATFTPKILAHPCRPVVTQRAVECSLAIGQRQAQCIVLPALAICHCSLIR